MIFHHIVASPGSQKGPLCVWGTEEPRFSRDRAGPNFGQASDDRPVGNLSASEADITEPS